MYQQTSNSVYPNPPPAAYPGSINDGNRYQGSYPPQNYKSNRYMMRPVNHGYPQQQQFQNNARQQTAQNWSGGGVNSLNAQYQQSASLYPVFQEQSFIAQYDHVKQHINPNQRSIPNPRQAYPNQQQNQHLGIPIQQSSVQSQHSSVPSQHSSVPSKHSSVPSQHSSVPSHHLSAPSQHSSIPSQPPSSANLYPSVSNLYPSIPNLLPGISNQQYSSSHFKTLKAAATTSPQAWDSQYQLSALVDGVGLNTIPKQVRNYPQAMEPEPEPPASRSWYRLPVASEQPSVRNPPPPKQTSPNQTSNSLSRSSASDQVFSEPHLQLPVLRRPKRESLEKSSSDTASALKRIKQEKKQSDNTICNLENIPFSNSISPENVGHTKMILPEKQQVNSVSMMDTNSHLSQELNDQTANCFDKSPDRNVVIISSVCSQSQQSLSPADGKTQGTAFQQLQNNDLLSNGNSEGNLFRKPKDKHRKRRRSSERSKSTSPEKPQTRICASPDSTFLPDRIQDKLTSPTKSPLEPYDPLYEQISMSPCSDTTIAYCDGQDWDDNPTSKIDNIDSSVSHHVSTLKGIYNECDESIRKRRRFLLGSGTECDSTNELLDEAVKSNSLDRLTPLRQNSVSSVTGCVSLKDTNVRYCVSENKIYYLLNDFSRFITKHKELQDSNYAEVRLSTEAESLALCQAYHKLSPLSEGAKLVNFKQEPEIFQEPGIVNELESNCDKVSNLTEDSLSVHNDNTSEHKDNSVLLNSWLEETNSCTVETNSAFSDNTCNSRTLKEELEKLSAISQEVIRRAFTNLKKECDQLRADNSSLRENLDTKTKQNNLLEDMLEKVSTLM
ncbi:uncharacterized protein LOC126817097 [Patella vulgata]|uniref:uncharacterized protein LOC126817097 n=1 Tax=Patella vulgata TaxID=6465 RepID=UPI0024A89FEE|nr:uncharacterized protein LOC126817097 [Patella vulgata]XP_050399863.2 uncharacterized protein LOC126817097 [Patella vulgata]XP_050399864.2 uncharacterized protein LOC126817097 [Patella vulgata]XP_050399865.2 uncharacterized protein LOC126817097 [Patella vulgata]XP_050399866.2 uncharacterized protein LOC126817097 [Patella vulgata]